MGIRSWITRAFTASRRGELRDMSAPQRMVRGKYAAASDAESMAAHWALADALDADAANSVAVRTRLRKRSRLERANNGHCDGIIDTDKNYVVGTGPKLRMQTGNPAFNAMVEARWQSWCKAVQFGRKLRTMRLAKTTDGEAFALLRTNPGLPDMVHLDLHLIECDQVTTPLLPFNEPNRTDGVWFDEFGNPTFYDVLPYHPGGTWYFATETPLKIPASFMVHWYSVDRPAQHRGVPDLTATLNLFAKGRAYREAVIGAARAAACFSAVLEMETTPDGPDEVQPFSTMPIEADTFIATPAGAKLRQMTAEQPTTTHAEFNRCLVSEEARPLSMSYAIAGCDSSGNSFSGTQNDQQVYYVAVGVERDDAESCVLDKVFASWFVAARDAYGWNQDAAPAPKHAWDWPGMPQIDQEKTALARKAGLSCGATSLSRVHSEDGLDFEDEVAAMAADYGVTVAEMRAKLFGSNFQQQGGQPSTGQEPAAVKPPQNGFKRNGQRTGATV